MLYKVFIDDSEGGKNPTFCIKVPQLCGTMEPTFNIEVFEVKIYICNYRQLFKFYGTQRFSN